MRDWLHKLRENRKTWAGALLLPLLVWALMEARSGLFEGTGWGPKQVAAKVGKWLTEAPAEKSKLETGSIQAPPPAKPDLSDVQKKEAAARAARRNRCEKERQAELLEAEKVLAIYWDRARNCIEEHKQYLFTRSNPEAQCTVQIKAREESEGRRDTVAGRKC